MGYAIRPLTEPEMWDKYLANPTVHNRNVLVEHYLPIVEKFVHKYGNPAKDKDDMFIFASIGLMDAVERFDPDRGVKFTTFAWKRIWGATVDGEAAESHAPRRAARMSRQLIEARDGWWDKNTERASVGELAEELGWSERQVRSVEIRATMVTPVEPSEMVVEDVQNIEEMLEVAQVGERVSVCVGRLPKREQLMLGLYYVEDLTFRQIAGMAGTTEPRVSGIHTAALLMLKECLL